MTDRELLEDVINRREKQLRPLVEELRPIFLAFGKEGIRVLDQLDEGLTTADECLMWLLEKLHVNAACGYSTSYTT